MAALAAFQSGEPEIAWEQAIKAQQGGVDMSEGFAMLRQQSQAPDDLDAMLAVSRVFIGPILTNRYEEMADRALQGGASGAASARTGIARRVLNEAAQDMYELQQEARRQFNDSRSFALVQRQDMAQLMMVLDVDDITDTNPPSNTASNRSQDRRRELKGDLKLVDIQTGEELYKRRVDFRDIGHRSDLNRDFARYMALMEEWVAERAR